MHTLIYWIEGGTQDLSGYLPSWSCLLVAQQLYLEGRLVLLSPGVGGARWRYPDPPQQLKGCTSASCPLSTSSYHVLHEILRWEALKQAQVRHPLVSRMFLGLCVIRDPVAWRWFIPVCRASLELLEAFYQPSVVPDEFWWAVCRQHLCDIFSGSWFCGLNSNWWSL